MHRLTPPRPLPCSRSPFRQWYESHYGSTVGKKRKDKTGDEAEPAAPVKRSNSVRTRHTKRYTTPPRASPCPPPGARCAPSGGAQGARI
jgi:small subunit ribosomal protein S8e